MKYNSDLNSNNASSENNIHQKYCEYCGVPIYKNTDTPYCERCRDIVLFQEVKEFIRSYDVNEFQVAAHFDIPLRIVKGWINEGRIEYKKTNTGLRSLNNQLKCEKCNSPITFGTVCTKCLKQLNKNIHGYDMQKILEEDRMFFLDNPTPKNRDD